jgi:S1-C subfamily serine protease
MVGGGLGFAVPSRTVQQFLGSLERGGGRAYLGVAVIPVPLQASVRARLGIQQESGILIAGVESGGPAEAAGVIVGDLLLALDGAALRDVDALSRAIARTGDGRSHVLTVLRAGERLDLALTPVARAA